MIEVVLTAAAIDVVKVVVKDHLHLTAFAVALNSTSPLEDGHQP